MHDDLIYLTDSDKELKPSVTHLALQSTRTAMGRGKGEGPGPSIAAMWRDKGEGPATAAGQGKGANTNDLLPFVKK